MNNGIENIKLFKNLRDSFIKGTNLSGKKANNINDVRKFLAGMTKSEINKTTINFIRTNKNLSELMVNSCSNLIKNLCGRDLFIQRRAHTIINVPGEGQAKQWTHYELMSGISPFTYVIWAPLHDLDDNGGVYYVDLGKSSKIMKEEELSGVVNGKRVLNLMANQKPTKLRFGEAIIFNPFVLHGNVSFVSKLARIACSVRFQNRNKPIMQKNTDFFKLYNLN